MQRYPQRGTKESSWARRRWCADRRVLGQVAEGVLPVSPRYVAPASAASCWPLPSQPARHHLAGAAAGHAGGHDEAKASGEREELVVILDQG